MNKDLSVPPEKQRVDLSPSLSGGSTEQNDSPAARKGPTRSDFNGELGSPVLVCHGCVHLGVHDWHYYYCSAQDAPNQRDTNGYPWHGAGVHLYGGARPRNCPYMPTAFVVGDAQENEGAE